MVETSVKFGGLRLQPNCWRRSAQPSGSAGVSRAVGEVACSYSDASLVCGNGDVFVPVRWEKSGATQWGTWLLRLEGDMPPSLDETQAYNAVVLPQWWEQGSPGAGVVVPEKPDQYPGVKG